MAQSEAIAAPSDAPNGTLPWQRAVLFIVFLGIVSLFGDMTYEGARSITGPYLGLLGVTATTIGIVAGFGELLGYGARLVSGYLGVGLKPTRPFNAAGMRIDPPVSLPIARAAMPSVT